MLRLRKEALGMPKLSIIVSVFNVERYIGKCIDSVLAQTFTDFELITVDDGSTDKSGAICDEYAERDSRIKVIHKENGGVSSARNVGLDEAVGDYIAFIDADDTVKPKMYEIMLKKALLYDCDIVQAQMNIVYENGESLSPSSQRKSILLTSKKEMIKSFICYAVSPSVCAKLFTKNAVFGKRFREDIFIGEDSLFVLEVLNGAKRILLDENHFYSYFQRNGSSMHSISAEKMRSICSYLKLTEEFVLKNKKDKEIYGHGAYKIASESLRYAVEAKNAGLEGKELACLKKLFFKYLRFFFKYSEESFAISLKTAVALFVF